MRFIDALIEAMKSWMRALTPKDGFPLWGKIAVGTGIAAGVWFLFQRFLGPNSAPPPADPGRTHQLPYEPMHQVASDYEMRWAKGRET